MRLSATELEAPRLAAKTEKRAAKSAKIQILLFSETEAANQNQNFPFHFLPAPPTPPPRSGKRNGKENFGFGIATEGSVRGASIIRQNPADFVRNTFELRPIHTAMNTIEKNYKFLGTISVFFVSVLLISNVASTKIVDFGWFTFDGGTLLFPLSYIFGDILTEVYGYKKARGVIWLGFFSALMMSVIFIIVGKLPAAPEWGNQAAYDAILGLTPRIVLASLIAYACGSFSNSIILAKMKLWTKGKKLWMRTIGSTVVGEFIDSTLFILIAFLGILPLPLLITLIISNYIFKTLIEVAFTPITYKVVNFLKKKENQDYYDKGTNFNPFSIK